MRRSMVAAALAILTAALLTGFGAPAAAGPTADFSLSVAPSVASVNPGHLTSPTVSTSTVRGAAQQVTFSISGLPAGVAAYFQQSSVTSGQSTTLTVSTTTGAPPGTYPLLITGTGSTATHTTTFTLTVNGAAGCAGTNGTDVAIPDNATVASSVLISHCAGDASPTSTVAVAISHGSLADLVVDLVAPDGSVYPLHDRAATIAPTYTVDLSGEASDGQWQLRVQDTASSATGYLDTWTVNLRDVSGGACTGTNSTDTAIPDPGPSITSSITLEGCTGTASATSTVEVHIVHPRIADLTVVLVLPDGTVRVLHDQTSGSGVNIDQTYPVDLSGQSRNGTWDLTVWDSQQSQTGHLDGWTLTL